MVDSSVEAVRIAKAYFEGRPPTPVKQKGNGKLYRADDFKPQHLRMIYDIYDNRIVDDYLDNKLPGRKPSLISF